LQSLRERLVIMAFSRTRRPTAALAMGLAALVSAALGASGAHAQAFGTDGEPATNSTYIDSDGTHPGPRYDCVITPSVCGPGFRTSSTGLSTSTIDTSQGFISGAVSATNVMPPGRARSSATATGSWWDGFTVDGAGLDPGTIVDLKLTVDLEVDAFQASLSSPVPYTRVQASINLGGPDAPSTAFAVLYGDGSSTGVGFLPVQVDTPFTLWGRFYTQAGVDETSPIQLGFTSGFANYYVDVVGIEALHASSALGFATLGGSESLPHLITASGHDYSSIPIGGGGGVPEPAAWAMLITGFGLAGAMARRRRAAAG
jgi:hypothetical protein